VSKNITVNQSEDGQAYLNLEDFKDFYDIDKVVYYDFENIENKALIVKFYDKNKELVLPKDLK
jgi:hypothetical protein